MLRVSLVVGSVLLSTAALAQDYPASGLSIGHPMSRLFQPAPDSLAISNRFRHTGPEENHGPILFTHRGSVVIGGNPATGDNRWSNQSGLEVSVMDRNSGGAVPATFHVSSPDSPATEPMIFRRSRATTLGGAGAVQAGDSLGVIQGQGDDGFLTTNIAATNILMRVQPGSTIIPQNRRGIAGNLAFATSPGDGETSMRTRLEINNTGQVRIIEGDLRLGTNSIRAYLRTMPNNSFFCFPLIGGTTGLVSFFPTVTPSNAAPGGQVFAHANVAPMPLAVIGTQNLHPRQGRVTGTTGPGGKLTLSMDGEELCAENRTGVARSYTFHVVHSGG